jgi:uncharacterized protein DUF1203
MQSYRIVAVGDRIASAVRNTLQSPGYGHPVFIHEHNCERYPEDGGFPIDMCSHSLTLNAYGRGRRLISQKYVSNGVVEPQIQQLLQNRDVAYIHVRNTDAGCYAFCIERTSDEEDASGRAQSNRGGDSHE